MKQHILQTGSSNVGLKSIASIFSCTNIKLLGKREVLFDPSSLWFGVVTFFITRLPMHCSVLSYKNLWIA